MKLGRGGRGSGQIDLEGKLLFEEELIQMKGNEIRSYP